MSEVTREMRLEGSPKIIAKLIEWTDGMSAEDRTFKIYNEAMDDAVSFVTIMAQENLIYAVEFRALARKMKKELPLLKGE